MNRASFRHGTMAARGAIIAGPSALTVSKGRTMCPFSPLLVLSVAFFWVPPLFWVSGQSKMTATAPRNGWAPRSVRQQWLGTQERLGTQQRLGTRNVDG